MRLIQSLSLRTKLLLLLILTTLIVLLTFARVSMTSFKDDKVAYVFDSILVNTKTTAALIKAEVDKQAGKIQTILRGFDPQQKSFHELARSLFLEDPDFEFLETYEMDTDSGEFGLVASLYKEQRQPRADALRERLRPLLGQALNQKVALMALKDGTAVWALGLKFLNPVSHQLGVTIAVFNSGSLLEPFFNNQIQNTYLLNGKGELVLHPSQPAFRIENNKVQSALQGSLDWKNQAFGVKEIASGREALLASYAQTGVGGLWVAAFVPRSKALDALSQLLLTTGKILLLLVSLTVFVSVLLSNGLTGSLNRLHAGVVQVTQGNLDIQVKVRGQDEIGDLAKGFNQMTSEIKRLIEETKEKARMEGELQTAKVVQSTLFPQSHSKFERAEVCGFFQPASECSGDWWDYQAVGSKLYIAVGDATGHGVSAALVTAAARSASILLAEIAGLSVSERLQVLNRAINGTMKAKINMTLFLGCLDQETGEFVYSNASHDPPVVLPYEGEGGALSRNDVVPLLDAVGKRLGEDAASIYQEATIQLKPGQILVINTDGLTDLKDPDGKSYGERRYLTNLLSIFNASKDLNGAIDSLRGNLEEFRKGQPLDDDVTCCIVRFG